MAPKTNCNAAKLTSIVSWFQRSRIAHSIKDLEKAIPSVASINGMQVKDYLQTLQDESRINVEKIGSGNWYWSFPSQERKLKSAALSDAQTAHEKASIVVADLREKLAVAAAQRDDEEDSTSPSRAELTETKAELDTDIKDLAKQLAAYSDSDPTELERKKREVEKFKVEADEYTDAIYSMEGWFKKQGMEDALPSLRLGIYGDEFDTEEFALKELV